MGTSLSPIQSPLQSPVQSPVQSAVGLGGASGAPAAPTAPIAPPETPVQQGPLAAPVTQAFAGYNCYCAPQLPVAPPKPPVAPPAPPKPPVAPPKPPVAPPTSPKGGPTPVQSPVQQSPVQKPTAPPAPPKAPKPPTATPKPKAPKPVKGGGATDKTRVTLSNTDRHSEVKLVSSKGTSVEISGDPHVTTVVNGTTKHFDIGYGKGTIKLSGGTNVSWNTYNNASHALLTFGIDAPGTKDDDSVRTDDGKDVRSQLTALTDAQLREFITKLAAYQGVWNKPLHK